MGFDLGSSVRGDEIDHQLLSRLTQDTTCDRISHYHKAPRAHNLQYSADYGDSILS